MSVPNNARDEPFTPQIRVTYTKLAGMTPPEQGALIRFGGLGGDSGLFRVLNEPELDEQGTFTIEVESVASPDGI